MNPHILLKFKVTSTDKVLCNNLENKLHPFVGSIFCVMNKSFFRVICMINRQNKSNGQGQVLSNR